MQSQHPIQEKVQAVGRRVRRLQAVYALARAAAVLVAVAFAVGLADFLLRFEDAGVRLLASVVVWATLVWVAYRYAVPGCTRRTSEVHIAQQIERHFPHLHNRLASALDFLRQSEHDPTAGSPELRRAVIAHTAGVVERLDFHRCLNLRLPRGAVAMAATVALTVAGLCALNPGAAGLAVRRLLNPFSGEHWPRRNVLEFIAPPAQLALGTDFEVELVDRNGHLPEVVHIYYWFDGEEAHNAQVKEMKFFGDKMVHRLENVRRAFHYRAAGGDDSTMAWNYLEVVEPPRIDALQIHLYPPEYSGWPDGPSGENIQALEGTQVAVTGTLTKAAAGVEWKTDHRELPAVPVKLTGNGNAFAIPRGGPAPWTVRRSAAYWFEACDADGVRGGSDQRWAIRAIRDVPPTVSLEKPGANTFVTPSAVVPLEGVVKDDLRIATIVIRYRRSDQAAEQERIVEVFRGPATAPRLAAGPTGPAADAGDRVPVSYAWDVSQLAGLMPGAWIEFHVAATDYKPQTGHCTPRRLTIISLDELEDRIAARQAFILGQLAEVLRVQRDARSQTKALEIQLQQAGRLAANDVDQLQSAELNERQVAKLLTDPADGVRAQIGSLLHEVVSNRIDRPEVVRRMEELQQAVERIERQLLPPIQVKLLTALKAARAAAASLDRPAAKPKGPPDPALGSALATAGQGQDEIIDTLERLLGELTQWDTYRRFAREISRIRQDQEDVRRETEQVRIDTLGRDPDRLDPQQKATLKRVAERQFELARRFDKVQARMDKMRGELRPSDPLAAETLGEALDAAYRGAISGQMRESGRHIEGHRAGQAAEMQKDVLRSLSELLDRLAGRRENELDRRNRKLDEAEASLQDLQRKQQQLTNRLGEAAGQQDAAERKRRLEQLAREQQQVAEETKGLARQLQRLQADRPAASLDEATAGMQQSADAATKDQAGKAQEQSRLAQKTLERAQRELTQTRRQTRQDLLHEQMVRLQQDLQGLASRQQSAFDATRELDGLRAKQEGRLTRPQLATAEELAKRQRDLATEAGGLAQRAAPSPPFVFGLQGVTREMDRAGKSLDRRETGDATQQPQRNALARILQLVAALKRDLQPPGEQNKQGGHPPNGPTPSRPPVDAIQRLSELKLLKSMQQEVNRRTLELDAAQRQGALTPAQLEELNDLAREQGRLADMIIDLAQAAAEKPEDDPESLPGKGEEAGTKGEDKP